MKKYLFLVSLFFISKLYAIIPGYGLNYGVGNFYAYNEFNSSTANSKDKFFLSFFEYGIIDWFDIQLQSVNYPNNSYNDLGLGGCFQLWKSNYLNLRNGILYNFGPNIPNAKADSINFNLTSHGKIIGKVGYIYQTQYKQFCHNLDNSSSWYQQFYLTYDLLEDLTTYISLSSEFENFDKTVDTGVGFWYNLFKDKFNLKWSNIYFDIANLTEKYEDIRISIGLNFLF